MKNRLLLAFLTLAAAAAHADSRDLTVKAEVEARCKFTSGTLSIDLGKLDPSAGGEKTAGAVLTYECTYGVKPSAIQVGTQAAGSYSGKMKLKDSAGGANQEFAYRLSWPTDYAAGMGFTPGAGPSPTRVGIDINATVAEGAYSLTKAGAYEDTVSFTITP
ncbi:spore coat protein U domain-containing protein [Ramlibacter sp. MAHUQ-53]|uniref:spore coat protein U domain-containing protein n=1 Tax=unclassified Ramlibacter TaxID=2617605 RepID=UPI003627AA35